MPAIELIPDGGSANGFDYWREEHPSGILYFTRYDVVPIMIDALFDMPPTREYSIGELADVAEVSLRSAKDRFHVLVDLDIIDWVQGSDKFRLNLDSEVTQHLWKLDSAINDQMKIDDFVIDIPDEDSLGFTKSFQATVRAD